MKLKMAISVFVVCVLLTTFSCNQNTDEATSKDLLDKNGIDSSVKPQNDFFSYVNGTWIKNTEIPAAESGWSSFAILYQNTTLELKSLLDSCANLNAPKGSNAQKVGDLYTSAMDSAAIEQKGITPLKEDLQRIADIQTPKDVLHEVAVEYDLFGPKKSFVKDASHLINFNASQDEENSNIIIAHFDQDGLGLPNKEYYTKQDSSTINIRDAYVQYIAEIFHLSGDDIALAKKEAADVMKIENALAAASKSPVELRDPKANYHKMTLAELNQLTPNINWQQMAGYLNLKQDTVVVGQPDFYKALGNLLVSVPLNDWKNYLRFHLIDNYAPYLSTGFVNANFNMGKLLTGQKKIQPRWKRMVAFVDNQLSDALGQLYVAKYFPPEAKERILNLVNNLQATYKDRIEHLSWMSDTTKQKAIIKLNAIRKKIGYPDKWKDYSSVTITKDNLIQNYKNTGHFAYRYMMNKIGKPVDRSEWFMTAPTINAYYSARANDINFPAGILQPPFFYKDGDDAINYGAIGVVIGHEMTHGFDDQGKQYDANGNLKNWWLPADSANFRHKADLVVKQYNKSVVLDSLHINGELTQGENIADIGGISIAYEAFKKTDEGKSDKKIGGLTPDQRFFMAYAEVWRSKMRPENIRSRLLSDPHSAPMYRVNNPLSDMPAFYKAFNVVPGDKMYVADSLRALVW
ncbi:MAG: M13 family metallopeptidase [Bacteroidota bacterium]|nr:M13 family metallopeptidase [Bacteroidota bacterium]